MQRQRSSTAAMAHFWLLLQYDGSGAQRYWDFAVAMDVVINTLWSFERF